MLKTCANDTFSSPRNTAKTHEHVTAIETIVQNLYRLTKFYHLIVSTGISPIPIGSHERCIHIYIILFEQSPQLWGYHFVCVCVLEKPAITLVRHSPLHNTKVVTDDAFET